MRNDASLKHSFDPHFSVSSDQKNGKSFRAALPSNDAQWTHKFKTITVLNIFPIKARLLRSLVREAPWYFFGGPIAETLKWNLLKNTARNVWKLAIIRAPATQWQRTRPGICTNSCKIAIWAAWGLFRKLQNWGLRNLTDRVASGDYTAMIDQGRFRDRWGGLEESERQRAWGLR